MFILIKIYNFFFVTKTLREFGPIAIAINGTALQWYSKGIIEKVKCDPGINHAVTLVGYGSENGVKYWKFKNSWGTWWGEKGYFRVKRDENACGIENEPSFYYTG